MLGIANCRFCAKSGVRLGSSAPRHAWRALIGTRRRFCPACGEKWTDDAVAGVPRAVTLAAALAAALLWPSASFVGRVWSIKSGRSTTAGKTATDAAAPAVEKAGPIGLSAAFWKAWDESKPRDADLASRYRTSQPRPIFRAAGVFGGGTDVASMMRLLIKSATQGQLDAVDRMNKKQLWDQYGKYFGSKEEAQQAYDQYKKQRAAAKQP